MLIFGVTHYRMVLAQSLLGQTVYNIFNLGVTPKDGSDGQDSNEIFSAFASLWVTNLEPFQSTYLQYLGMHLTSRASAGPIEIDKPITATFGTLAGTPLPSEVAANVRLVDSVGGLKAGSKRIAGLTSAQMNGNYLTTTYFDNLQAALNTVALGIEGGTGTHQFTMLLEIEHSRAQGSPLNPHVFSYVTDLALDSRFTTQRSRRPRLVE